MCLCKDHSRIRREIAALRGLGPRAGSFWVKKEQAVDCHFFLKMSTLEACATDWGISLEEATDIQNHNKQEYWGYYDKRQEGDKLELIPNNRWFDWVTKHPDQNKVYDAERIAQELHRKAAVPNGPRKQPLHFDRTNRSLLLDHPMGLAATGEIQEQLPCKGLINEALDTLFEEWRRARPFYKMFSNDGILGEEDSWRMTSPKIAFVLKESNADFVEIRGQAHGPQGNHHYFWRNLSIWKYVVTSIIRGEEPSFDRAMILKDMPLTDVAYVNLKKNAECKSQSVDREISKYVRDDWYFLSRQIEIINPDILFLCGTFRFVKNRLQFSQVGERIFRTGDRIMVDFFHPACRKGYEETFYCLRECLKQKYLWGK